MPDTTPDATNPTDPELAAAQREANLAKARKEKAEAEKGIAEAQRDKLAAEFAGPGDQSKITAPTGDVTSDQGGFVEIQMLGQRAARVIARRLTERIEKIKAKTLIIYNSDQIASLSALAAALEQLEQLASEYEANTVEAEQVLSDAKLAMATADAGPQLEALPALMFAPSIATGVVKSVAELVNLFRTTTDFKNQTVTVTEDVIISYLVNSLADVAVYYPAIFPPNIVDASGGPGFALALKNLKDKRLASQKQVTALEDMQADLNTKISTLTAPTSPAKLQSAVRAITDVKSKVQLLNTAVEQLSMSLEVTDAATKQSPLAQLIRGERLASIIKGAGAFTLRVNVTANGTSMIRKNLFTNARVQHSAGVSLVYQLFDQTGRIINADALQYYFDWKTADEVRELLDNNLPA